MKNIATYDIKLTHLEENHKEIKEGMAKLVNVIEDLKRENAESRGKATAIRWFIGIIQIAFCGYVSLITYNVKDYVDENNKKLEHIEFKMDQSNQLNEARFLEHEHRISKIER